MVLEIKGTIAFREMDNHTYALFLDSLIIGESETRSVTDEPWGFSDCHGGLDDPETGDGPEGGTLSVFLHGISEGFFIDLF